ncbi:hypothetical protein BH10ACI1_BH10ACI1_33280 [soil metagenome]
MLKILLDTNILLICLATKSKYRPIFDALLRGKFELIISNEILTEYIEILERKTNQTIANNVAELLLSLTNVRKNEVYYRWNILTEDYDDNKFVDCAIAANADFIVSNDRHFNALRKVEFPKVTVITADNFLNILQNES